MMSSTFPRWKNDTTPRFVGDLAAIATRAWNVTILAPHHAGAARREVSRANDHGELDVRRFRYWLPASRQQLCYGGGILPNLRASKLALAQVPSLVGAELAAMRRLLAEVDVDIVHAHFIVPQGAVAALAARRPLIVSIHGSDIFALRGRMADAVTRSVLNRAAIVTVNSQAVADEARRRFPEVERKLRFLPMGVDTQLFHPPAPEEQRAPPSDPVIAFVGRLSEQKGAAVLLDAFARLGQPGRLVVAGEGPERARLVARGLERVDVVGPLPPVEVASLMRKATLLVVPSLDGRNGAEAQGLVAIEAMAAGCPLVVTRSGGLADIVSETRGVVVAPSDPVALAEGIASCLANPGAMQARAEVARAFAIDRYDWARIGKDLLSIYEEARRC